MRSSSAALRARLRDFTDALGQQMYFWGRDVVHPDGNLLCLHGCERRKSEGLEGTSCYRKALDGGAFVELHGACVGHYPGGEASANFLFIRTRRRCYLHSGTEPPAPGLYPDDLLATGPAAELYTASCRFLDWWLDYEDWIAGVTSPGYREACRRAFAKLPKSSPWLEPEAALAWLRRFRDKGAGVKRARRTVSRRTAGATLPTGRGRAS